MLDKGRCDAATCAATVVRNGSGKTGDAGCLQPPARLHAKSCRHGEAIRTAKPHDNDIM